MLRITRVINNGMPTLILSGRIGAEQLPDLRRTVDAERTQNVVIDLSEVTLVDGEVVRFFLHCEQQGIGISHCPAYIRDWMVRENSLRD